MMDRYTHRTDIRHQSVKALFWQTVTLIHQHNRCLFWATIPHLVLQVPHTVLVSELLVAGAALWQDTALKSTHVEEQVGVVFAVDGNKAVLPLHRGDGSG